MSSISVGEVDSTKRGRVLGHEDVRGLMRTQNSFEITVYRITAIELSNNTESNEVLIL